MADVTKAHDTSARPATPAGDSLRQFAAGVWGKPEEVSTEPPLTAGQVMDSNERPRVTDNTPRVAFGETKDGREGNDTGSEKQNNADGSGKSERRTRPGEVAANPSDGTTGLAKNSDAESGKDPATGKGQVGEAAKYVGVGLSPRVGGIGEATGAASGAAAAAAGKVAMEAAASLENPRKGDWKDRIKALDLYNPFPSGEIGDQIAKPATFSELEAKETATQEVRRNFDLDPGNGDGVLTPDELSKGATIDRILGMSPAHQEAAKLLQNYGPMLEHAQDDKGTKGVTERDITAYFNSIKGIKTVQLETLSGSYGLGDANPLLKRPNQ